MCCQVKSTYDLSCVQRQLCRDVVPSLRLKIISCRGHKGVSHARGLLSALLLFSDVVFSQGQCLLCPAVEVIRQTVRTLAEAASGRRATNSKHGGGTAGNRGKTPVSSFGESGTPEGKAEMIRIDEMF